MRNYATRFPSINLILFTIQGPLQLGIVCFCRSVWLHCICRKILNFQSSIGVLAPALVAHLPHDALTNLAYPSLAANVFSEGQIRPVTYEIYFSPHLTLLVMS